MSIELKVREVEQLFRDLDSEIEPFQKATGLSCASGCGKCCTHNQIDASPLEFLPWAFHLYLNGESEAVHTALSDKPDKTCHIYRPIGLLEDGKGSCSSYIHRGLICRLFGYGANTDKYGKLRLATCSLIKANQPLAFVNAQKMIDANLPVPVFTHYYMRLSQIDYQMGSTIVPINTALKMAIEAVFRYYTYHPLGDVVKGVA